MISCLSVSVRVCGSAGNRSGTYQLNSGIDTWLSWPDHSSAKPSFLSPPSSVQIQAPKTKDSSSSRRIETGIQKFEVETWCSTGLMFNWLITKSGNIKHKSWVSLGFVKFDGRRSGSCQVSFFSTSLFFLHSSLAQPELPLADEGLLSLSLIHHQYFFIVILTDRVIIGIVIIHHH